MVTADGARPASPAFPALPPGWIARSRLHRAVALGTQRTLTTVTGPPGSGKTVLLSGWAQRASPRPVAWLSLDEIDNDPSWFWRHLAAAVQDVDVSLAALFREWGARSRERNPPGAAPTAGVTSSSTASAPVVIIVDDVQLLAASAVIEAAGLLLRHLPTHVRLVLSGRFCPPLPVEPLRTAQQLFEIRPDDLPFTTEEAIDFFASPPTSPLPIETVATVVARSEGWAAGLRMADLMWQEGGSTSALLDDLSGEGRLIAGYFDRELLDHQTADRVRFLLATSVFDELTAEGCALVTGRRDSGTLLNVFCDEQVLLARVNTPLPSYRYHPLFLQFLRYKLHRDAPAVARSSHLRAAAWSQACGDEQAAVRHLIQAGSYDDALTLGVLQVVRTLDGGYLPGDTILAITDLPEPYLDQDPLRRYLAAAAHLGQLRLTAAGRHLRALERTDRAAADGSLLEGRAELLWAWRDGLRADAAGVLRHSERAAGLFDSARSAGIDHTSSPGLDWVDALDDTLLGRVPALTASAHLWVDDLDAARAVRLDRTGDADSTEDPDHLIVLAGLAYGEGRLDDAFGLAERALDQARRPDGGAGISTLDGLLVLTGVHYERNELDSATGRLEQLRQLCRARSLDHWRAAAECEQARILVARGQLMDALDHLRHLRHQEVDDPLPPHLDGRLDQIEIRCRVALGDLDGAGRLLQSSGQGLGTFEARARLELAAGRPDRAARRLTSPDGARPRLRTEIERELLLARAHLQLGDQRRANVALGRAIELGRPGRFIRVFVDEGPEVGAILRADAGGSPDPYLTKLLSHQPGARLRPPGTTEVLEPLTDREREVLGHLPSHLAQHEIATVMDISLNTVKTHTKAVYRKLGASSRSQAVDLARAHGLI